MVVSLPVATVIGVTAVTVTAVTVTAVTVTVATVTAPMQAGLTTTVRVHIPPMAVRTCTQARGSVLSLIFEQK